MITLLTALTLVVGGGAQSPSTLAAVTVFAANVDREWPTGDREPAATGEALRLMEVATQSLVDESKLTDAKLRDAITSFRSAREALAAQPAADPQRIAAARTALESGVVMIDRLATALGSAKTMPTERAALKRAADGLEKNVPLEKQGDVLERYFKQASAIVKTLLDSAP